MPEIQPPFGLPFFEGSKDDVRSRILALARLDHRGSSVIFANAHLVVEANSNTDLKLLLNEASLVVPDGVPVAWVMKNLGLKNVERYSGPDVMRDLFDQTPNSRHFFLGSSPEVLGRIKNKFKGQAVGFYSPPFATDFSIEEKEKQIRMVQASKADFIWVGLGAPKQERYVVEMARSAGRGVWLAVGAAFDFYAGTKPRAPEALQRLGLEWSFRMFTEPKRLTIRYLKTNPKFIRLAFRELIKKRDH